MRIALILFSLLLSSCFQTENSSSLDADMYGNADGTAEFLAARTIMSNNCAGTCHAYHTQSETQLKAAGLFVAGSPENSKLYCRLAGSSTCSISGSKNMPQGGALNSTDVAVIKTWIQNATP